MSRDASGVHRIAASFLAVMSIFFLLRAAASAEVLAGYDAGAGYQHLEMGTFPQTLEGGREPIVWRVLSVQGDTVYLLSEFILFNHRLHNDDVVYERSGGDFSTTEICQYLNGPFLQHFSAQELALMAAQSAPGPMTLLSREDLKNAAYGFTDDLSRRGYATPMALQNGQYQYGNGSSPYWTRSQSTSQTYAAICTKENGNLGYIRVVVQNEGCRPACSVRLDLMEITGGSGTLADPYRIGVSGGTEDE